MVTSENVFLRPQVFINFVKQQTGLIQEDIDEDSVPQSLASRLRTRASSFFSGSSVHVPVPAVVPHDPLSDDSLDISDDETLLTLDSSDGVSGLSVYVVVWF